MGCVSASGSSKGHPPNGPGSQIGRPSISAGLTALAIALSSVGCSRVTGGDVQAQVISESKSPLAGTQLPGGDRRGSRFIDQGDHIRTAATDATVLRLLPGILVRITDSADFVFEGSHLAKNGNDTADVVDLRTARASLLAGSACVLLSARSSEARLHLVTPNAVISAAADSLFVVEIKEAFVRLFCARGTCDLQRAGLTHVTAGESYRWPTDNPSAPAVRGSTASDVDLSQIEETGILMQRASDSEKVELGALRP